MTGDPLSLAGDRPVRIIRLLRVRFSHIHTVDAVRPDFLPGGATHGAFRGPRVLVSASSRERNRLWINGDAIHSPFLVFLRQVPVEHEG